MLAHMRDGDADAAPATTVVHAGRPAREPDAPLNVPIVATSTYHAGGPVGYGRYGNPTWSAFESAVGALEGGRALAFASGMAAVAAALSTVPEGATVVAADPAYSGSTALLREMEQRARISLRLVDPLAQDSYDGAALVWLESPTNPCLDVVDLRAAAARAHAAGALTVVDSTFATPLGQRPLDLGADVVVHSASKYLAGHSDCLLGVVVTRSGDLHDVVHQHRSWHGAVPGALETWLALRGVRTLHVRMERAQANAMELARRLTRHPAVVRVRYPGLPDDPGHAVATSQMCGYGAVLAVELADPVLAEHLAESVRLWVHATSLGGVESTLERRRRWPAESARVPESLLRLSAGIEDVDDLWTDLEAALPR